MMLLFEFLISIEILAFVEGKNMTEDQIDLKKPNQYSTRIMFSDLNML